MNQDLTQAMVWHRKSAAKGNWLAMWNLGHAYETGAGVQKDTTQARTWMKKSADLGYVKAKRWLASHPLATTQPSADPSSVPATGSDDGGI